MMQPDWYQHAVIYQVDPVVFLDTDGDGWGNLNGITRRLDYIRGMGVNTLWLLPFFPSPFKDWGYDITDFLGVDPRFGDMADISYLIAEAEERGIHVLIELVMQHTSDEHPWFQEARKDRNSPYRDYFIWADEPEETDVEPAFPTVEDSVWTWDEEAGQYYRHVFYKFQPDLNIANPRVRREIDRVMQFWMRLGVSGFRIDAAAFMVKAAAMGDDDPDGFGFLENLRHHANQLHANTVLLGEVASPPDSYLDYFGDGDRINMLLNFWANNFVFLALARGDSGPIHTALAEDPDPPRSAQYATWLRNHDELSLHLLSDDEADEVLEAFAPEKHMQAYGRGTRRRLAPMLDGDERRLLMAYAMLFSLPGTPIIRYGDEIGMGDDLELEERMAIRTPMQWSDEEGAGFSTAPSDKFVTPVISSGPFSNQKINVFDQSLRDDSLLNRISALTRARIGLHEVSAGLCQPLDVDDSRVLAVRYDKGGSTTIALVNLTDEEVTIDLPGDDIETFVDVIADSPYEHFSKTHPQATVKGYGYRWLRRFSNLVD
jgi:maltose alpha-D-glucosyltransferase / alpha-amylase